MNICDQIIVPHISHACPTTGTCPDLEISNYSADIINIQCSPAPESAILLDLIQTGQNRYKMKLKRPGEAIIEVKGERYGQPLYLPDIRFTITNPTLQADCKKIELNLDGASTWYNISYRSSISTAPIPVASSDELADGNSFAPSLYNEFLKPKAKVLDGIDVEYIDQIVHCSSKNIRLWDFGESGEIYLEKAERSGELVSMLEIDAPAGSIFHLQIPIFIKKKGL